MDAAAEAGRMPALPRSCIRCTGGNQRTTGSPAQSTKDVVSHGVPQGFDARWATALRDPPHPSSCARVDHFTHIGKPEAIQKIADDMGALMRYPKQSTQVIVKSVILPPGNQ